MGKTQHFKRLWVLSVMLFLASGASFSSAQTNTFPDSGNAGIGTTEPAQALHISSSLGRVAFQGSDPGIEFRNAVGTAKGYIQRESNNKITFYAGGGAGGDLKMVILDTGNVGIGTTSPSSKLHVAGDATIDGNIAAKYQDVAEWVPTRDALAPGTVVVIDPMTSNRVLPAAQSYDTRVAGVVSAQPGILLGEGGTDKAKVAHSGRVKVKADAQYGPIGVGDILVTSATPGYAMRSVPVELSGVSIHRPGTIVGKALQPLKEGKGEILVLLTLQ